MAALFRESKLFSEAGCNLFRSSALARHRITEIWKGSEMRMFLLAGAALIAVGATPVLAQSTLASSGTGAGLLNSKKDANVPATAAKPAGQGLVSAGGAVATASGAHGGGPAPIVSGAVPQTKPFTSSVTDGTAKIGKGLKATGGDVERSGVTVSPAGGERGVASAPAGLERQAARLPGAVVPH